MPVAFPDGHFELDYAGAMAPRNLARENRWLANMLKPLDNVRDTVRLIASVSGERESRVKERLLAESEEIGTNVHSDLLRRKTPLHVASREMDRFYEESDAFLYETTIWNCCAAKERMRVFIESRLAKFGMECADVFCFGDGLGFDSAHLARQGHRVRYYDLSRQCRQFAAEVFRLNGVEVLGLESLDEIPAGSLDVLVCLDVLEHVSQPGQLVELFRTWLKPEGLLIVHAPFWNVHWTRATHLRENLRYSGDWRQIYGSNGFRVVDASFFWDPIIFRQGNGSDPPRRSLGARIRFALGQSLMAAARFNNTIHNLVGRWNARTPSKWVEELRWTRFSDATGER